MRLSDEYIIKYGANIDLGDMGDFVIEGIALEDDVLYLQGTYYYRGWIFDNTEIAIYKVRYEGKYYTPYELIEENKELWGETADIVMYSQWIDWIIYPTDNTQIMEKGDDKYIKGTNFDIFIRKEVN